jgi:hypothetical protein
MRAVIRMEGEGAREILMKGTSLDLLSGAIHRRHLPPHALCRDRGAASCGRRRHLRYLRLPFLCPLRLGFLLATAREPARITLFGKQTIQA